MPETSGGCSKRLVGLPAFRQWEISLNCSEDLLVGDPHLPLQLQDTGSLKSLKGNKISLKLDGADVHRVVLNIFTGCSI